MTNYAVYVVNVLFWLFVLQHYSYMSISHVSDIMCSILDNEYCIAPQTEKKDIYIAPNIIS